MTGVRASTLWYRFRATFGRRWRSYLSLVVLLGLLGAVAMASLEAARRTQSAYPAFLAHTNATDITLSTYGNGMAGATQYSSKTAAAIAHLPEVKHVESWFGVYAVPLKHGAPQLQLGNEVNFAVSNTGLYFDEDRATAVQGRLPNPNRVDEFMTTALGARLMGIHLGQVIPIGLYLPQQSNLPGFGTAKVPPDKLFEMRLVGIVEFNNAVVEDATDQLPTNAVYTPAFSRQVPEVGTFGTWYGIQLSNRAGSLAKVEQDLLHVLPPGAVGNFNVTASTTAKVERAVEPESIALGVFGLIAVLAALGTALLVISRDVQLADEERRLLRALGAPPLVTLADTLFGVLLAIVIGTVLAGVIALALSPLAPLGPIHNVFHPGLAFDWTVLGGGMGLFVVVLGVAAIVIGVRRSPERLARRTALHAPRSSRLAQTASGVGVPLPGVLGIRFALEPGRGRTAVPARAVLIGAVIAVLTATATLTFGNSLNDLVTHPSLYGWNWTAALQSENDVPPSAQAALSHDPKVAAWSGYSDPNLQINGQTVPALITGGVPTVGPPILSGHTLSKYDHNEVVVGASTLARLHKSLGDTVQISYGTPNTAPLYLPPLPAVIVGTATFPAIAGSSTFAEHTSLGTGMLLSYQALPAKFRKVIQQPDPVQNGPSLVFVRMRPNVSAAGTTRDMHRIVAIADHEFAKDPQAIGDTVISLPIQRPAEIVNYQSTGSTPELLAAGLAAGAALGLALALGATARRRRPDLALLKTFGLTRRQLAVTLISQATVTVVIGVVVGIPLGVAIGRQLWILFAENIDVVPHPAVPLSIGLVALGALLLAVVVALVPGRTAATTPAAVVLRQE